MSLMSKLFGKKVQDFIGIDQPPELEIPSIVTSLGLRINGLIKMRIGVTSFFLLNDKYMIGSGSDGLSDSYVIKKITVTDSTGGLDAPYTIVRAFTSNGIMFNFNCPDGMTVNDLMVFVPITTPVIPKKSNLTEGTPGTPEYVSKERWYAVTKDVEFDHVVSFNNLRSKILSLEKTVEKADEVWYSRSVDNEMSEYLLVRQFDKTINNKNYLGVVINEQDIERI